MKTFLVSMGVLLGAYSQTNAQIVGPQVLPVNGAVLQGGGATLSSTLGQPFTQTLTVGNEIYTSGFQQPEIIGPPIAPAAQAVCSDTGYTFTFDSITAGSGGNQIEWATNSSFSGSTIVSSPANITIIISGVAKDTIWIRSRVSSTGSVSCAVSTTIADTIPSITITNIVNADSVSILTASGGTSYFWNNAITSAVDTCSVPGLYFVTVTDADGCSALGATVVTAQLHNTNVLPLKFHITVPPGYNLNNYTSDTARLNALMALNSTDSSVLSGIAITGFHSDFPHSGYQYLRNLFLLTCVNDSSNYAAILSLHTLDSTDFPSVKWVLPVIPTGTYTPNDCYGILPAPTSDSSNSQLDYINARTAWGITKGNSNVGIAINEAQTGCDLNNPDLKVAIAGGYISPVPSSFHGTAVAGCAAAVTDNDTGIAGIGFNCSLHFNNDGNDSANLYLSQQGYRIINSSWTDFGYTNTYTPNFNDEQMAYDEIYENGTSMCFSAGNGESGGNPAPVLSFEYPASLDHNISVGPVGYQFPVGQNDYWPGLPPSGIPYNWKDCHEESPGPTSALYDSLYITLNYSANDRVDICAPAYSVVSTSFDSTDLSSHYFGGCCGTSFASPIVAGTIGLMLSANSCLSPYQIEYLLKTTARSMEDVEYNFGSGSVNLNAAYVGKMGAGALDAGAAVTAASTFNCNDLTTQTMYVAGVELNTICKPGYSSNGIKPQFSVLVVGGTPPYTYRWDPVPGNSTTLDNTTSATPTITSGNIAYYRLGVYDNSAIQQVANKVIVDTLTTSQTPKLVLRDSYMDMLNEPNTQAIVNSKDWNIFQSPDVWNRRSNDNIPVHQDPTYSGYANYANARVRNVGCTASAGTDSLFLYWTKASTGENWNLDWTTATVPNDSTGDPEPAGGVITTIPLSISALNPGDTQLLSAPWYPPNPAEYDPSLTEVDVCLLGRIQTSSTAPYGMTFPEGIGVKQNILNNNKIATRNLLVTGGDPGGGTTWHQIELANPDTVDHQFTIEILPEKAINKHFAGDLSAYAQTSINLGELSDRWTDTGSFWSSIVTSSGSEKIVNFIGDNKLVLQDITIHANEKIPVMIGITVIAQPLIDQYFYIRQWLYPQHDTDWCPYGSINFLIVGSDTTLSDTILPQLRMLKVNTDSILPQFTLYPNPTSGTVTILCQGTEDNTIGYTVTDVTGNVLINRSGINIFNGALIIVDLSMYQDGMYYISIVDNSNKMTIQKIVKQKP